MCKTRRKKTLVTVDCKLQINSVRNPECSSEFTFIFGAVQVWIESVRVGFVICIGIEPKTNVALGFRILHSQKQSSVSIYAKFGLVKIRS